MTAAAKTAMDSVFERAGIPRRDMEIHAAIRRYARDGGSFDELVRIARPVFNELQDGGQHALATRAENAAVLQTDRGGGGRFGYVDQSSRAPAVREPSAAQRAAATRVRNITALDTFRVRDGRAIGDVRFGELERLRTANAREAAVIRQIQKHGSAPHDALVRDIIKVNDLNRMIQRAAEIADAS